MRRTVYLCLLFLLLVGIASAKEQFLIKATNDQDSTVDELALKLDERGRLTHLLHTRSNGKTYSYAPPALAKGVVLRRKSGRDLITLKTTQFSPDKGADVVLTYLYSAVPTEQRRALKLKLVRDKEKWTLASPSGKAIQSLYIKANVASVMGFTQAIGIAELKLIPAQ